MSINSSIGEENLVKHWPINEIEETGRRKNDGKLVNLKTKVDQ